MVLNASWRRHSTSDPWTVKTTAGTYKTAEKRCLTSTLETGRWNRFTAPRQWKHRKLVFAAASRAGPALPIAMRARYQIWTPASHPQMCFLIFEFLLTQLSHCDISNTFLVFPAIPSAVAPACTGASDAVHVLIFLSSLFTHCLRWSLATRSHRWRAWGPSEKQNKPRAKNERRIKTMSIYGKQFCASRTGKSTGTRWL